MSEQRIALPVNHEEALQLASYTQENSNLARCYLDLAQPRAPISDAQIRELDALIDVYGDAEFECGEWGTEELEDYELFLSRAIAAKTALRDAALLLVAQGDVLSDAKDAAVRFAGMVLRMHRNDGYPGDIDGDDLERMALLCGLIEKRTVTEPCGETCTCAEVSDFPVECFFNTDAGRAAIAASTKENP